MGKRGGVEWLGVGRGRLGGVEGLGVGRGG